LQAIASTFDGTLPLSADRKDLKESHRRYAPPRNFISTNVREYCAITADKPNDASSPHKVEPLTIPKANTNAERRPARMAVAITAKLLGPGLATPNAYIEYANATFALTIDPNPIFVPFILLNNH
jgi:hypothetical protein